MADRTPEEIAMGLSKRMRSLLTELPDDGPMVDFRPCVFDFPMPTLMALVKRGLAKVEEFDPVTTDLGRAVAAILHGEKADG